MIWIVLFISLILFLSIGLTILPSNLIPFTFSSKIVLAQHFQIPFLKVYYFEIIGLLLVALTILTLAWPRYRTYFSIAVSLIILSGFNTLLSGYLIVTVVGVFWVGRHLKRIRLKSEFRQYILLWSLWAVWCIALPWIGVMVVDEWDMLRIIFLHICALKVGTYGYDTLIKEKSFSFSHTWQFFLAPIHFLIIPSWIACPFPSQFQSLKVRKYRRKTMKWATYKLAIATFFFIVSITGSIGYLAITKKYLTHYSDYFSAPFLQVLVTNFLHGFLCFLYFIFIAASLQSFYAILGFRMSRPIYHKPYLTQHIFDFWNRMLIQTKDFILNLFIIPSFNFLRHHLKSAKLALGLSILIVFFILDIPLHLLGIFRASQSFRINYAMFEWYLALMGLFGFYYFCRNLFPKSIQDFGHTRFGRMVKTVFWICAISFFY
jgi:hypothetical protein